MLPIPLKRHISLSGASESTTIIEADNQFGCINSINNNQNVVIRQLSLRDGKYGIFAWANAHLRVEDVTIENMTATTYGALFLAKGDNTELNRVTIRNVVSANENGGAIYIANNGNLVLQDVNVYNCVASEFMPPIAIGDRGDILLDRCHFSNNTNNSAETGNAIFQLGPPGPVDSLRIRVINSLFDNNHQARQSWMGGIMSFNNVSEIENCTFVDNTGGGSTIAIAGNVKFTNNVFYNSGLSYEIVLPDFTSDNTISNAWIDFNDIRNGSNGVFNDTPLNHLYWGEGNINADPLFAGGSNSPYYLTAASPLIDVGTPDTTGMGLGLYDVAGNERIWDGNSDGTARIDIGAYEYQPVYSPENLTATLGLNYVHLSWGMEAEGSSLWVPACAGTKGVVKRALPGDRALSGYRVYRDSVAIADIDSPQTLDYIDRAFTESDTVTYYVVALYGTVESEASNSITVYLEYVHNEDNTNPALRSFSVSPNPFVNHTIIRYTIGKASTVDLVVYNIKGQVVKTISSTPQSKGDKLTYWDGKDEAGKPCSSGIYLVRLSLDGKAVSSRKVTLVK